MKMKCRVVCAVLLFISICEVSSWPRNREEEVDREEPQRFGGHGGGETEEREKEGPQRGHGRRGQVHQIIVQIPLIGRRVNATHLQNIPIRIFKGNGLVTGRRPGHSSKESETEKQKQKDNDEYKNSDPTGPNLRGTSTEDYDEPVFTPIPLNQTLDNKSLINAPNRCGEDQKYIAGKCRTNLD